MTSAFTATDRACSSDAPFDVFWKNAPKVSVSSAGPTKIRQ